MLPAGSNPLYYVEDMLGSSRVITQSNGVVCYDADFYPYGGERSYTNTCPQNYKFEGKERYTETGLDHTLFRQYSSSIGRWMTTDPAGLDAVDPANPQSWNRYAYVLNNPMNLVDAFGLDPNDGCTWDPIQNKLTCPPPPPQPTSPNPTPPSQGPSPLLLLLQNCSFLATGAFGWSICLPPGHTVLGDFVRERPDRGNTSGGQTQACGTSGFHGGIGITGGANADVGLGVAGATASGSAGGGLFYDSKTGFSDGLFATGAAVANFFSHVAAAPSQSVQPGVLGAYGGASGSIFITNARSVQQLSGPFTTYSLNVGVGPVKFSVQYASGGPINVLSIGPPYAGVSIGGSITRTTTNTVTQQRGCN